MLPGKVKSHPANRGKSQEFRRKPENVKEREGFCSIRGREKKANPFKPKKEIASIPLGGSGKSR